MSRAAPAEPRWSVGIVVPARDEGPSIEACLASVLAAPLPPFVDRHVVVVADCCSDDTAQRAARALGPDGTVVAASCGTVGRARRHGTAAALDAIQERHGTPLDRTWLLTTDADSTVPVDWVRSHLAHARAGAEGVAGTVAVASFASHPPHVATAYAQRYVVHPDGTHPHVHGANLGVRADAYLAVGGWADLATAEDHDLWRRLGAAGAALVTTIEAPVTTSGRGDGRAPSGFAALLTSLGKLAAIDADLAAASAVGDPMPS